MANKSATPSRLPTSLAEAFRPRPPVEDVKPELDVQPVEVVPGSEHTEVIEHTMIIETDRPYKGATAFSHGKHDKLRLRRKTDEDVKPATPAKPATWRTAVELPIALEQGIYDIMYTERRDMKDIFIAALEAYVKRNTGKETAPPEFIAKYKSRGRRFK